MLLKKERGHVGRVHLRIHNREMFLRELRGDLFDRLLLGEPDADDQIEILLRKGAQHRLEGIVVRRFDIFQEHAEFLLCIARPLVGGRVERLVILAAAVQDQADFEVGWRGVQHCPPTGDQEYRPEMSEAFPH